MSAAVVEYDVEREPARIESVEELDRLLDAITAQAEQRVPVIAEITGDDDRRSLDIGLGAAEFSILTWYDDDTAEVVHSRGTKVAPGLAGFDFGGTWTDMPPNAAISIDDAREAAREFLLTGRRPTNVSWQIPDYGG